MFDRNYLFFLITNNPANTVINPNPKVIIENSGISALVIVILNLLELYKGC